MNAIDPGLPAERALVDSSGRLVETDARLGDLNGRCGGAIGAPIAIPPLAMLVHLVQRLRILVSRSIVVADGERDVELWVRAEPDSASGGVGLTITGWKPRPGWQSGCDEAARDRDFIRGEADWLWETDPALRLVHISVAAAAQHGVDATALLGQPLTRLFAIDSDEDGALPMLGALALRARFDDQPARVRATGQAIWLSAVPRLGAGGGFAGLSGAVRMADPASPAVPAIDTDALTAAFSTRLDQALRAPLGRIIANADSINAQSEGPLRQDYADYAADIATAGRHLLGLVDDLVDLQAIERPDFIVATEAIDLADVARRAAGLLQVRAAAAHVRIDRPSLHDTLPASGEFRRALQILVNLIGNAVRYSPDGGMIWVRAEREAGVAAVIVADQGRGIAIEDQARIFEKFERVDTSEPGGSGLGLYIARRLARAMGGDITLDSAPGQGARFVFTLPGRDA